MRYIISTGGKTLGAWNKQTFVYVACEEIVMNAQSLEVSLLAVGTVLHVDRRRDERSNDYGEQKMSNSPLRPC